MVLRAVVVVLFAAATVSAHPGPAAITDEHPKIELVTMGIGALMWERHGHIAMCVTQNGLRSSLASPEPGDRCFNYGIADFQHPITMAWGFVRGTHSFWVGTESPVGMLRRYSATDRTIWVQPLPLDAAQKTKVIAKLEDDILDDHRYYAYDHFADNCTTRIRDIIDNATDHALSTMTETPGDRSFRDYARDGFYGMRIPLLITDIVLGRSADRVPTYWDRMFLPQYLREAVQTHWGVKPYKIYERNECIRDPDPSCVARGIPQVKHPNSGRWLFALAILVLTAPAWLSRRLGRSQRAGLAISILPYWLLGVALTVLAIISPLPYLRFNETILVWFPIDIAILFLSPAHQVKYAKGRVAMLALIAVLLLINVLHQPLWAPLLWPLIPMAAVAFWPATK
ncbi:MAG TPA: DUF4105 domain-containing protein [Kofleriaceae bacterium]|nr:DUF4105 domain-containing protein [Kofleriaceae bacterium]